MIIANQPFLMLVMCMKLVVPIFISTTVPIVHLEEMLLPKMIFMLAHKTTYQKLDFSTILKNNNRVAEEAAPGLTLTATVTVLSTVLVTTNIKRSNDKKINERYNIGTKSLNATMIRNSKPSSIGFTFTVIHVTIYWMDLLVVHGYNLFKIMLRVRPSTTNLLK